MAFSAQLRPRHYPLALLLISAVALTGCRGDSNISSLFPGASAQSVTETTQATAPPASNLSELLADEPAISNEANEPVNPGSSTEHTADQVSAPVAVEDPIFIERPTLQWDSPLTREDGSKLYPGEISGYKVYFRLRHQERFQTIVLEGPDANRLKLDDFDIGAYEFAVSTLDSAGLESRRSAPVPIDLI